MHSVLQIAERKEQRRRKEHVPHIIHVHVCTYVHVLDQCTCIHKVLWPFECQYHKSKGILLAIYVPIYMHVYTCLYMHLLHSCICTFVMLSVKEGGSGYIIIH